MKNNLVIRSHWIQTLDLPLLLQLTVVPMVPQPLPSYVYWMGLSASQFLYGHFHQQIVNDFILTSYLTDQYLGTCKIFVLYKEAN